MVFLVVRTIIKHMAQHQFTKNSSEEREQHAWGPGARVCVHKPICCLGVRNKFYHWSLQHLISELFSLEIAFAMTSLVTPR